MQSSCILWRRLDRPGHDVARLKESDNGSILEGTAVFVEDYQPCRLDYHVVLDTVWRTVAVGVSGWLGLQPIEVNAAVNAKREWVINGRACPEVQDCDDIDLSFSPATNLLPIRRMSLPVGEKAFVRAAWLRFPACVLEPLDQTYERVGDRSYQYESAGGAFVARLEVSAIGFVTRYADLWQEE